MATGALVTILLSVLLAIWFVLAVVMWARALFWEWLARYAVAQNAILTAQAQQQVDRESEAEASYTPMVFDFSQMGKRN